MIYSIANLVPFLGIIAVAVTAASASTTASASTDGDHRVVRDELNRGSPFGYDKRDPALEYVPFINFVGMDDCHAMEEAGNSTELVNCGLEYPPPAGSSPSSLTWAFGSAHRSGVPGKAGGPNWIALDNIGTFTTTPHGLMTGLFNLTQVGFEQNICARNRIVFSRLY